MARALDHFNFRNDLTTFQTLDAHLPLFISNATTTHVSRLMLRYATAKGTQIQDHMVDAVSFETTVA